MGLRFSTWRLQHSIRRREERPVIFFSGRGARVFSAGTGLDRGRGAVRGLVNSSSREGTLELDQLPSGSPGSGVLAKLRAVVCSEHVFFAENRGRYYILI